jgi:hypothetical protein
MPVFDDRSASQMRSHLVLPTDDEAWSLPDWGRPLSAEASSVSSHGLPVLKVPSGDLRGRRLLPNARPHQPTMSQLPAK